MDEIQKNRGIIIFEGILFTILGILAISLPIASTFATEQLIGWLLIIGGLVQGYRTFKSHPTTGFYISLFGAILNLVLGILLIIYPVAGAISLTLLLIFFFLLQGISKIVLAFKMRPLANWGWFVLSGVLSIFMAIILALGWPGTALWAVGLLLGINMVFFGAALLFLGIALPKIDDKGNIDIKKP
ncbi:MAG: HdeD family acid-resistance protein [Parachlamydiaceae bacterium]|nr:HdeD family acid-resistance protein [Parachlamydiaceae bacterium]